MMHYHRHLALHSSNVVASEVSNTAVLWLSSSSRVITGEIVMVDGGFHVAGGA
jgi:enoyl-[acyl-carrier-protein] reductase (NADH)